MISSGKFLKLMPRPNPNKKTVSVTLPLDLYEAVVSWAEMKEWSVAKAAWKLIEIGINTELGIATKKPATPRNLNARVHHQSPGTNGESSC